MIEERKFRGLAERLTYEELMQAKQIIEQEMDYREEHNEPIEFRCPKCEFRAEEYITVHQHMMSFHRLGYSETIGTIIRIFP